MLFPEARAALERAAGEPAVSTPGYDVEADRRAARDAAAAEPRVPVAEVVDVDAGGVSCRLYRPAGARPGTILHLHGGGFVFNDVEVHDNASRRLAVEAGHAVLSLDYRLAPEHPFPAARDDVDAVLAWLDGHGAAHGLDGPLAGHGDSAGANLALVAALRHPGRFAALALVYPFLDPRAELDSHRTETRGFDPADVAWYWESYVGGDPSRYDDPDVAPLLSPQLATLPPTFVMTAEHDPLRDEGEALAHALVEVGVDVVAVRYLGQLHGFWRHPTVFPSAAPLTRQSAGFLAAGLAAGAPQAL